MRWNAQTNATSPHGNAAIHTKSQDSIGMAARTPGVCDLLGYSQHTDDCAANTIQELFFFADNIKEWTQPLFLSLTEQHVAFYVDRYIAENPDAGGELATASFTIRRRTSLLRGLLTIRQRFLIHYEYIVAQREAHAAARTNPRILTELYTPVKTLFTKNKSIMARSKRRGSVNMGQVIKSEFESNDDKRKRTCADISVVMGLRHYTSIFPILCKMFGIPFLVARVDSSLFTSGYDPVAIGFLEYHLQKNIIPETGVQQYTMSSACHSTALIRCNGDWYYYNGINGMAPIHLDMKTAWVAALLAKETLVVRNFEGITFLMKAKGIDIKGAAPVLDPSVSPTPQVVSIWTGIGWSTLADIKIKLRTKTSFPYEMDAYQVLLEAQKEILPPASFLMDVYVLVEQEMGRVSPPATWPPPPPSPPPPPPLPPRAPSFRPKSTTAPLPKNPPPRNHRKTRRHRRRV